jgi:hypothetical protein
VGQPVKVLGLHLFGECAAELTFSEPPIRTNADEAPAAGREQLIRGFWKLLVTQAVGLIGAATGWR